MMNKTLYLAFKDYPHELEAELKLKGITLWDKKDCLYLVSGNHPSMIWAQLSVFNVQEKNIQSISEASEILRQHNRNWSFHSPQFHRRSSLISEKLPFLKKRNYDFLDQIPTSRMGFYTLWTENQLLYSAETSSPLPLGEISFNQNKTEPPSRAYLKLWEFFTLQHLKPGDFHGLAIDVGSCPGGWTWVLANLNLKVISVDKAPIESSLLALPNVDYRKANAFNLSPDDFDLIDWFCSDIICYPEKLYQLVKKFYLSKKVKNFITTIKYQEQTDWQTTLKFLEIPNSNIIHLNHNKHEVTWSLIRDNMD